MCIAQVKNKATDGKGAEVKLTEGGVGKYHVSFKFTSKRGKSIDVQVEIYGKYS